MSASYEVIAPCMTRASGRSKLNSFESFEEALSYAVGISKWSFADVPVYRKEDENGFTFYDKVITVHPHPGDLK